MAKICDPKNHCGITNAFLVDENPYDPTFLFS